MSLAGIHNVNEFYSHHYLAEIFAGDIQATLDRWREQAEAANARTSWAELRALAPEHLRFRRDFERERRAGQRILRQREWFRLLLEALGYVNERRSRSSIRSLRWCQAHRQDA